MQYELRQFARKHFPEISHRKQREHAGELKLVDLFFNESAEGHYVEVGANDPFRFSQTWYFEQKGWTGALVEPIPELCELLKEKRPNSTVVQVACGSPGQQGEADFNVGVDTGQSTLIAGAANVGIDFDRVVKVQVRTLDEVLDELKLPRLDFISIDVEGLQLQVLQGFDIQRHRPRLLLLEDHLHDLKSHRHLKAKGYRLVKRTSFNNWYIPADEPFTLTSPIERFALWRKLTLHTPLRAIKFALRKKFQS